MPTLTHPDGTRPGDLHLTRRTAVSMFFAGYALAAVAADAAPITTSAQGLIVDEVLIPNGAAKPMPAYLARPAGRRGASARHAAVIVVNEVFGVHEYIKDICRRLAQAGYVAIAPEFFYRSGVDLPALTDFKQIMPVVAQATVPQVDADVRATSAWLKAQAFTRADAIGITGFCWGGSVVWRAAMVDPDIRAGVAWYGRLTGLPERAGELRAPVLGLYGALDQGIPQSDIAAMRAAVEAAGKRAEIVVYPDAPHGFHADYRDSYRAADAQDGWARLLRHFRANGVA